LNVARIGSANQSIKRKRKGPKKRNQENHLFQDQFSSNLGRDDLKYDLQKQSKAGCARTADEVVGSFYPILNVSLCEDDQDRTVATSSLKQKIGKNLAKFLLRKTKFPKEY
jgi:hypothetical protein